MKAKDTVMNKKQMERESSYGYNTLWEFGERIARTQAEISFQAGYKQALKDNGIK